MALDKTLQCNAVEIYPRAIPRNRKNTDGGLKNGN